jgi:REP element-mobilizing transposase RayT
LQGSKRGYVKDGNVYGACFGLKEANIKQQKVKRFVLTKENRESVKNAILDEAKRLGQDVLAMSISATHVHMVVDVIDEPIETSVARYKRAATKVLRSNGIKGMFWTKGFDKRFCFDRDSLKERIKYVEGHNPQQS